MKSKRGAIKLSIGTIVIIVLGLTMLISMLVLVKNIFIVDSDEVLNYTFILNGENMSSLMVCENFWHYEKIEGFIPCVLNGTIGGIGGNTIDWELSPQDNCKLIDAEFTGLNLYNETRAKELYDSLLPQCFEFKETGISNSWLNSSGCVCSGEDINSSFITNCERYNCGSGLLIAKK